MKSKVVYVFVEPTRPTPPWYALSIAALKKAAARRKLSIQTINSLDEAYTDAGTRAIVVIGSNDPWIHEVTASLHAHNIHPVLMGSAPGKFGEHVSGTQYSNKSSVEALMQYYYHCGRRRIALMGINSNSSNDIIKCETFIRTGHSLGIPAGHEDIFIRNAGSDNPAENFYQNIARYDGVICISDYIAIYLMQRSAALGVRVPEDLFVSGTNDILLCRYTRPTRTTTVRRYPEAGEQAFNIWDFLTSNPGSMPLVTTVPCEIIIRGSTAFMPPPQFPLTGEIKKDPPPDMSAPQEIASMRIRALDKCLTQCDALDMRILQGLFSNQTIEQMAESFFISEGTVSYRLKKLYIAAGVQSRSELESLFRHYIPGDEIFSTGDKIKF